MKQPEDTKTLELHLTETKRGRGRPAKPNALTPAERAKRYRDAKRADTIKTNKSDVTKKGNTLWTQEEVTKAMNVLQGKLDQVYSQLEMAEAERNAAMQEISRMKDVAHAMQFKLDAEHLALVEAKNKLATLVDDQAKPPKVNPLAAEVRKLKKALAAMDAEHNTIMQALRNEHATAISVMRNEITEATRWANEAPQPVKAAKPKTNRTR